MSPLCVNCARVAPGLCTYHIMDLSGCDLDKQRRYREPLASGITAPTAMTRCEEPSFAEVVITTRIQLDS